MMLLAFAVPQSKPDFSGVWQLNLEKSTFRSPAPKEVLVQIEYREPTLVQTMLVVAADGGEQRLTFAYNTAGRESTIAVAGGEGQSHAHWSDSDPSGLHMSEVDLPERLARYGGDIHIERVALRRAHIGDGLPWFSVEDKRTDSRYGWFIERHGRRCWELDALNPVVLRRGVETAIQERIDIDAWTRADVTEQAERESLVTILDSWPGISRQAPESHGKGC